jgi:hypothetical protein
VWREPFGFARASLKRLAHSRARKSMATIFLPAIVKAKDDARSSFVRHAHTALPR